MAWVTLILITHRGSHSPYTYAGVAAYEGKPVNREVNGDAPTVVPVTRFFYDGTTPNWPLAHNVRLPLHSFHTSIVVAFVRSYLTANDVVNWVFIAIMTIAALRAAWAFGLSAPALLLGLATIYALPFVIGCIGNPMHYIVGPVINFLVVLAAITMSPDDLRKPHVAGLMSAIMTLNYDWYIFGAALAIYLLFVIRFDTLRAALLYVALALAPIAVWKGFIDIASNGEASYGLRSKFFGSVVAQWMVWVHNLRELPLLPFTVSHIGVHIGFHQILTQVWWPLLGCCIVALWQLRPPLTRITWLMLLLIAFFGIEQIFTAAFDPENNPRRALAVVCAFSIGWCWVVDRYLGRKWWFTIFVALFALTAFLAFADTLLQSAALAGLYMGEAVRADPKWVLGFQAHRVMTGGAPPTWQQNVVVLFPRAAIGKLDFVAIASQVYIGGFAVAFFWILAKARLLPRFAPLAFIGIWLLSGVRFVW